MFTIMVIEDNEGDQLYDEIMLTEHLEEVRIIKAYDGKEALDVLASLDKEPDVLLLDINMPRMNGHEFLEQFSVGNTRHIPVVVMLTSSAQHRDKSQALQYKCVKDYLLKPIDEHAISMIAQHAHVHGRLAG